MQRRQALALFPALLAAPALQAQSPDFAADVDLLALALRELHPGSQRYLAPAALSTLLHRLRQDWAASGPAEHARRFLGLHRVTAALRCGHSYPNYFNQRGLIRSELVLGAPRLPLHFDWLRGGRAVVSRSASPLLRAGDELLAIDGRSMAAIRATLLPLVRGDGSNDAAREALLAPSGSDEIETFDVLYPLVFGSRAAFQVRWRNAAGRVQQRELAGLSHAQRRAMANPALQALEAPSDATPPWPLRFPGAGQALLTMPGWAMYRSAWDWQAYLGRVFEQLQQAGTRHLVIDLRGNEGGLDCGDAILARLIDAPLDAELFERRTVYQRLPDALQAHVDTWDDRFRDWGPAVTAIPGTRFWRQAPQGNAVIQPAGPRFRGRVSVLVDGSNHSATFRFALLARRHGLARLVGGSTGGNQQGANGGAFFFLRLPASGIEVDVPLIGSFARAPAPDAGLQPDLRVERTAADVAAGRDPVLAAALR